MRSQKAEVRIQKSEFRSQKSEQSIEFRTSVAFR